MSDAGVRSIAVICEADADRRTACNLADRVLTERVEWIEPDIIEYMRRYRGVLEVETYTKWTDMVRLADKMRIFAHGFSGGRPREPDAAMAERALLVLKKQEGAALPDAVILSRDTDKAGCRIEGFKQARDGHTWPFKVILGVAVTKRECWVLAGFEPQNDIERLRLDEERKNLGFDPREKGHLLAASEKGAKHEAKRVLKALTNGDAEREDACLHEVPLERLRQRGTTNGLKCYLDEIEEHVVPLFDESLKKT